MTNVVRDFDASSGARPGPASHIDALTGLSEQALIEGVRQGVQDIMATLFRAYFALLVKFARRYLKSVEASEDVVVEVMTRLWERRTEWTPKHTVESYLFAAVRNAALNTIRSEERDERRMSQLAMDDVYVGAVPVSELPDEEGVLAPADRMQQALSRLSDRNRTIIDLRWRRHMSFAEIAEVLGTTAGAVQRQHSRAIVGLREMLGQGEE